MSGRPKRATLVHEHKQKEQLVADREMKHFDCFMVRVNRYTNEEDEPDTESVEIGKAVRKKMLTSQASVDNLNGTQDWRNKGAEGQPVIQWYFPHNTVKSGSTYEAHDEFTKGKRPKAIRLVITTNEIGVEAE